MGKYSQERFPRLAIVGSHGRQQDVRPAADRWWASERTFALRVSAGENGPAGCYSESNPRMAVMPDSSRGWLATALFTLWRKVASHFATPDSLRRPAAVLSFRRHALRGHHVRPVFAGETFASKKNNGSVHWSHEEESPREGGRG
jgi:hypothetical protein